LRPMEEELYQAPVHQADANQRRREEARQRREGNRIRELIREARQRVSADLPSTGASAKAANEQQREQRANVRRIQKATEAAAA
jgi:hypothetical protein